MLIRLSDSARLFHADCRDAIRSLPDNSIDSVCTDPPYGLQFMGAEWDKLWRDRTDVDKAWRDAHEGTLAARARKLPDYSTMSKGADMQATHLEWAKEAFRVLKPGGFIAAFSASRTYHRMACAIEDAGFEIRDSLMWLYGTGYPKSRNVSRDGTFCQCESSSERDVRCMSCTDVSATAPLEKERSQILQPCVSEQSLHAQGAQASPGRVPTRDGRSQPSMEGRSLPSGTEGQLRVDEVRSVSAGISSDGADGRLHHGTPFGDGQALQTYPHANAMRASSGPQSEEQRTAEPRTLAGQSQSQDGGAWPHCGRCGKPVVPDGLGTALKPAFEPIVLARKPLSEGTVAANVLRWGTGALNIDGCRVPTDETITATRNIALGSSSGGVYAAANVPGVYVQKDGGRWPANVVTDGSDEVVGAFPAQAGGTKTGGQATPKKIGTSIPLGGVRSTVSHNDSGSAARFFYSAKASKADRNGSKHPTVKPIALMQWLARLITPPGGTVLDPFAGSGTTGAACEREGFACVLVEREDEYVADIRARFGVVDVHPWERILAWNRAVLAWRQAA